MKRESTKLIGKTVKVIIDRPLGSTHPKHSNIKYEVNYGFVPNTISGDGEEIDAYILGITEKIKEYEGKCIAVIRRQNEDDDKLIIVPRNSNFKDKEIEKLTHFQEQYFTSKIIRK